MLWKQTPWSLGSAQVTQALLCHHAGHPSHPRAKLQDTPWPFGGLVIEVLGTGLRTLKLEREKLLGQGKQ